MLLIPNLLIRAHSLLICQLSIKLPQTLFLYPREVISCPGWRESSRNKRRASKDSQMISSQLLTQTLKKLIPASPAINNCRKSLELWLRRAVTIVEDAGVLFVIDAVRMISAYQRMTRRITQCVISVTLKYLTIIYSAYLSRSRIFKLICIKHCKRKTKLSRVRSRLTKNRKRNWSKNWKQSKMSMNRPNLNWRASSRR